MLFRFLGIAVEQARIERRLQGADAPGHRRVVDLQALGRGGELAGARNRQKELQIVPAHGPGILLCLRSCNRSEEHTSELQSLMRISYAVFCLKKKKINNKNNAETS